MSKIEQIEEVFALIGDAVEWFAAENKFSVGKCLRGNSGWELTGDHPEGGSIHLLLLYDDSLGLGIGSNWQVPCPEMALLYSHFRPIRAAAIQPTTVIEVLTLEVTALSAVKFGHWTNLQPLQANG